MDRGSILRPGALSPHPSAPGTHPAPSLLLRHHRPHPKATPRRAHVGHSEDRLRPLLCRLRHRLKLHSLLKQAPQVAGAQWDPAQPSAKAELPPAPVQPWIPVQGISAPSQAPSAALPAILANASSVLQKPEWFLCYTFKGMLQF